MLVAEDDPTVSGVLVAYLSKAGLEPIACADGPSALAAWGRLRPQVVVLDLMLPDLSGLEVLRRRRADDDPAAVLIVSALGTEDDRLAGLEWGADDYVVKPFSPREVVARVQAMLRRADRLGASTGTAGRMTSGGLVLDAGRRTVRVDDRPVVLTRREFDLLAYLMAHPRRVFSKDQLMRRVWSWDFGDTSTVTVHVRRLRERIEADPADPRYVVTTRGVGYSFAADVVVD